VIQSLSRFASINTTSGSFAAYATAGHPLKGAEQMHRKFSCILSVATGPELLLKPVQWLAEARRRLLRKRTTLLV